MSAAARVMAQLHGIDPDDAGARRPGRGRCLRRDRPVVCDVGHCRPATGSGMDRRSRRTARDGARRGSARPSSTGTSGSGNLLARGEAIAAVIDWEIWSIGDPRIDVGLVPDQRRSRDLRLWQRHTSTSSRAVDDLARCYTDAVRWRSSGPLVVHGAGVLQVDGDVVTDRQAQSQSRDAAAGDRRDGTRAAQAAGSGQRTLLG